MKTGIVGWRGMVGSVLMERMRAERDFELFDPVFFSTSQAGGVAPDVGVEPACCTMPATSGRSPSATSS